MRWLLLFFLVLNAFYYVWHQQQSSMAAQDVAQISRYDPYQKQISLLSESPNKPERAVDVPAPATEQSACMFLGVFESREEAEVLRQRLSGLDVQSSLQEIAALSGFDYWVYLPPMASRGASLRQLKELQAMQIDSFIIAEGDLANGISLGIFPHYDSAEKVISRLSEVGYEPLLRKLERDQRNYWIRIDPLWQRLIDDALLASIATDFGGLKHELKPCESIDMEGALE